jgi:octaprenyl-diphosphate synthase
MPVVHASANKDVPAILKTARDWRNVAGPVEPFIAEVNERLCQQAKSFDGGLSAFSEYAISTQGKQLRPTLMGLCALATGGIQPAHVTLATIVEMVHLATLVHDDVMDEAEIRRSRQTMGALWGNETAVLFGDCLFAHALVLAAEFPTSDVCRSVATATRTVCSGEILQNQQRGHYDLRREDYFRVLEMKTAELFALSASLAAHANEAPAALQASLRQFGLALGTAYQIYDDCVDMFGSEDVAGKSLGTDLAKGKPTLPVLLFLERASQEDRETFRHLVSGSDPAGLRQAHRMLLQRRDLLTGSIAVLNDYMNQARRTLESCQVSGNNLQTLLDFIGSQAQELAGV